MLLSERCESVRRKPTDGELKRMCDFYVYLEKELRQKLGFKNYILRRMILGHEKAEEPCE